MVDQTMNCGDDVSDEPSEDFVALLVSHQRQVYAFIATLLPHATDIEDVYQQTCLALWRKRDLYDTARDFFPWACGFAKHEAYKHIRRDSRRVNLSDEMLALVADTAIADPRPDDRSLALDICLGKLQADHRDLLRRCYEGTQPIKEIATAMAISAAALTMRLQRIRHAVVRCVEKTLAAWEGS
jgi:RNA polymerase sigma-70 factor (ECF subfamily)